MRIGTIMVVLTSNLAFGTAGETGRPVVAQDRLGQVLLDRTNRTPVRHTNQGRSAQGHSGDQEPAAFVLTNTPLQSTNWLGPIPSRFTVQLLQRHSEFAFSMYGAPAELDRLKELVQVMREQKLGNAFDPGPTPAPNTKPVFDFLAEVGWPVVDF